ncbi:MAG: DUF3368 domain-containing protein [Caldilineaceae bacterium]|nr:DUF3368 domain-containing protein [Caldilineaceae bacterium]
MQLPVKGTLGILLAATWAELLSREEALEALDRMLTAGLRVSPRWQNWFRTEVDRP